MDGWTERRNKDGGRRRGKGDSSGGSSGSLQPSPSGDTESGSRIEDRELGFSVVISPTSSFKHSLRCKYWPIFFHSFNSRTGVTNAIVNFVSFPRLGVVCSPRTDADSAERPKTGREPRHRRCQKQFRRH